MNTRYSIIIAVLCAVIVSCQTAGARTIAFQRDGGIWISDMAGQNQQFLCRGYDPEISPDGRHVAFTHYEHVGPSIGPNRYIALCDIASKETRVLTSIPGHNHFGPAWSPRGDMIAFSSYLNTAWGVGVVQQTDTGYRLLTEGVKSQVYAPTWTYPGDHILCHGDGYLFTLDAGGGIVRRVPYREIVGDYGVTSATAFALSRDGKYLLFDADVPGESMEGLHEPPGAVFVHNVSSGETTRLTPPGICGFYPSWYADGRVLFSGFRATDIHQGGSAGITPRVYTVDMSGDNLKALIERASDPSVSAE